MLMDATTMADAILHALGGPDNVASSTHCATRLRVNPRDVARVNAAALDAVPGVLATQVVGEQVQVVVGPGRVDEVAAAFARVLSPDPTVPTRRLPTRVISVIVDVFTPLLPALVAGGLLTAIHNVLAGPGAFGDLAAVDAVPELRGPVALVGMLGAAVFALLPVLLGFAAAGRFGGSPYLGAAMGAALVAAPGLAAVSALPAIHLTPSTGWVLDGIDVLAIDYQGTVLPIIVICFVLARLERFFGRRLRGSARVLLVPLLTLLTTGLLAFLILGPTLRFLGDTAAEGMEWLYTSAGVVGGTVVGAVYSPLVVTGLHQGLIAIELGLLSTGGSFIFPIAAAANVAQAAATLAIWVSARRGSRLRALAATATVPAALGIAEPAIFGVTLRLRAPFAIAVGATAVAATLLAALRIQAVTLGAAGVFGFVSIAPGRVGPFLACLGVSIVLSFTGTLLWARWRQRGGRPLESDGATEPSDETTVRSPAAGTRLDVSALADPVFAARALGPTSAVAPSSGLVSSPAAGTVSAIAAASHAYGVTTDDGTELLVHVGIDTVRLAGRGFRPLVRVGDRVASGDALVHVDLAAVRGAGFDPVVLTIVTNADEHQYTDIAGGSEVAVGTPLMRQTRVAKEY
ncbi:PTS system sucrose-specific IIC component [Microbacterium sp. SORGH_AS 1204]|nr:PTS system sucrose-specific IIC component [Microbacterium sp. SORGH_AS_1204]